MAITDYFERIERIDGGSWFDDHPGWAWFIGAVIFVGVMLIEIL